MIKELHITVGLPASGKSTWANFKMNEWESLSRILRCSDRKDVKDTIKDIAWSFDRDYYAILDGLFLTNDDVIKVLNIFSEYRSEIECVIINYWKEDRENCLTNDIGRRNENSKSVIKNAELETMDLEYIKSNTKYTNIVISEMEVYKMTELDKFVKKLKIDTLYMQDYKIKMESWSLGGSYGSCWDDSMSAVSAEKQPEPNGFDELLEKLFGEDLSVKKYKEIKSQCLSIGSEYEGDYYGGGTEEAFYELDLKKLFEIYEEIK